MPEPIGSIIAFAGPVDPASEEITGWMLCDGRIFDGTSPAHIPLFKAIGFAWGGDRNRTMFNIPDLQGYFLRGVDRGGFDPRFAGDPDHDKRERNTNGGNAGRAVGSVQAFATARPKEPFMTSEEGRHMHGLNFEINAGRDVDDQDNTVADPKTPSSPDKHTDPVGPHFHTIVAGGDRETRPLNAYVNWIIRFK